VAKRQHVVPNKSGGWSVRREGALRVTKSFASKQEAVTYAKNAAKEHHGELVIHGADGLIKARDNYGTDPHPPKDKH